MDMIERISRFSEIVQVVSRADGRYLGPISDVRITPSTMTVAAITFHERGRDSFVAEPDIEVLGDVVVIASRACVHSINPGIPGRSLRELQGKWVRAAQGTRLGRVADLEFDPRTKQVIRIMLVEGQVLDVDAREVKIHDELLKVPATYVARVREPRPEDVGLLRRSLASHLIGEAAFGVRRALASTFPPWRRAGAA